MGLPLNAETWTALAALLIPRLLPALGATTLLGLLALLRGSVSGSGALGGLMVGTLFWLGGDWSAWLLLATFFITSSLIGIPAKKLRPSIESKHQRGGRRSWHQVLANTGPMLLVAGALPFAEVDSTNPGLFWVLKVALVAGFAAAAADTWAGEVGVLSRKPPRLLWGLTAVEPGQSGGVTWRGTLGGAAGAVALALVGLTSGLGWTGVIIAATWGFASSLVDSLLGATVQALYQQPDGQWTEKPVNSQGRDNTLVRGWAWMNNDLVNLISVALAVMGALVTAFFLLFLVL